MRASSRKSLDRKLAALRKNPDANVFILADAKDADLAWGCMSPGAPWPADGRAYRSIAEFRDQCREIVRRGLVDILLASTSTHATLAHAERLFADSPVTPAIRANDTTDVWRGRGATYRDEPSRPFATTYLEEAMWGGEPALWPRRGASARRAPVVGLGLYSLTFNNSVEADVRTLEAFKAFRLEAKRSGFRYFLEVFPPNIALKQARLTPRQVGAFVTDQIARTLASISPAMRPEFLKVPYFGPRAIQELRNYDPNLVIGILGGSSGTTHDAFKLLADAKRAGARCALFGRKIKDAEDPITFLEGLRSIADDDASPAEAVRRYHARLKQQRISPKRPLKDDLVVTFDDLTYTRL